MITTNATPFVIHKACQSLELHATHLPTGQPKVTFMHTFVQVKIDIVLSCPSRPTSQHKSLSQFSNIAPQEVLLKIGGAQQSAPTPSRLHPPVRPFAANLELFQQMHVLAEPLRHPVRLLLQRAILCQRSAVNILRAKTPPNGYEHLLAINGVG